MCKHWFHDHCAKVKSNFDKIARSKQPWNCRDCIKNMFPFYDLDNERLANFLTSQLSEQVLSNIHKSTPDCSICYKKIKKKANSLYCNTCKQIHHTKGNTIISSARDFECMTCIESKYPFHNIDNTELLDLSFNSITNCSCRHTNINDIRNTNET